MRILSAALAGGSVEFEEGLAIAVSALRARAGDGDSRKLLIDQAQGLMNEATRLKPGRDREGSDIWASHKRRMLASAQALGWLLGENSLAGQVLHDALALADSGIRRLPGTRVPDAGGCHSGLRRERPGEASGCRARPGVGAARRAQRPGPEFLRAHDGTGCGAAQELAGGLQC